MPKRTKPVAIPHTDLMTRRTRNGILLPVAVALLLVIIAITTSLSGLTHIPLAAGVLSILPLAIAIIAIRKLIVDSRAIMKELSSIAEKNEEVINSFSHK